VTTGEPDANGLAIAGWWMLLPEGWMAIDVDPRTAARTARDLVDAAVETDPELTSERGRIEQLVVRTAHDAHDAGVSFAAVFAAAADDLLLLASLSVGSTRILAAGVDGIRAELAGGEAGALSTIETDAGTAVRDAGLRTMRRPGSEEDVTVLSHQYWYPVPGRPGLVSFAAFATPTLALEGDFAELFDAMAATFSFVDELPTGEVDEPED
jgi:hypothetical protein